MYATLKIFTYFLQLFKIHPNHTLGNQIFQCYVNVYLGYTLKLQFYENFKIFVYLYLRIFKYAI